MTNQEAYETVVRGAHAQGWEHARDPNTGGCRVLLDGKRCHVGHLAVGEELQHTSAAAIRWRLDHLGVSKDLVDELQSSHDLTSTPEDNKMATAEVGVMFGLSWPTDVPQ